MNGSNVPVEIKISIIHWIVKYTENKTKINNNMLIIIIRKGITKQMIVSFQ